MTIRHAFHRPIVQSSPVVATVLFAVQRHRMNTLLAVSILSRKGKDLMAELRATLAGKMRRN